MEATVEAPANPAMQALMAGSVTAHVEPPAFVGATRQYLLFTLSNAIYGVDSARIREIIEYGQVTEVPMMPETIRGVINLRGAVVPLIDLSARFGRGRSAVGRRTCCVILEVEGAQETTPQTLGIVVDAVNEVLEIPAADIEPPPAFGTRLRNDFIVGMAKGAGRFVILLDLARILSLDELAGLAELAGETASSSN